jgi:hypothetical protein
LQQILERRDGESAAPLIQHQDDNRDENDSDETQTPMAGSITPLDPDHLMQDLDEDALPCPHPRPQRLTGRLLRTLGQRFPVGDDKEVVAAAAGPGAPDTGHGCFHDPLPSITRIARQGWSLHEQQQPKCRARKAATLPAAALPAEDMSLLRTWTPEALQKIMLDTTRYFEHGMQGSKRDVAAELDPLQRGLITKETAIRLFESCVISVTKPAVSPFHFLSPQLLTCKRYVS